MRVQLLQSCPTLCNPMDCNPQASLSIGFSQQEYWSELPCPPPGDLPNPGIEPTYAASLAMQMGSLPAEPFEKPIYTYMCRLLISRLLLGHTHNGVLCVWLWTHNGLLAIKNNETLLLQ